MFKSKKKTFLMPKKDKYNFQNALFSQQTFLL